MGRAGKGVLTSFQRISAEEVLAAEDALVEDVLSQDVFVQDVFTVEEFFTPQQVVEPVWSDGGEDGAARLLEREGTREWARAGSRPEPSRRAESMADRTIL